MSLERQHPLLAVIVSDDGQMIRAQARSYCQRNRWGRTHTGHLPERLLKQSLTTTGYRVVSHDGKQYYVHRLVLETFGSLQPSPDHQAAHWDGDKLNNHITNLRWATSLENNGDRIRHGHVARNFGSANVLCRLSEADVIALRASGLIATDAAQRFGISVAQASRILRGLSRARG